MERRLAHNSTAADIFPLQFKLRFDQRQNHTALGYQLESTRQDQSQRDKRHVDHTKIDKLRNVLAGKKPRIHFFHDHDARIVPNFPGQLAVANIDCKHFRRAAL